MIDWTTKNAQYMPRRIRPALKWHGGKYYLARRIISQLPQGSNFCEPFAGGANVLLNLVPGDWQHRVLGELNPKLVMLYNMLRDRVPELTDRLRLIPYQEESFKAAYERDVERKLEQPVDGAEGLDTAVDFLVRMRMSRGGLGTAFAWSDRLRGGQPGDLNAWCTLLDSLGGLAAVSRQLQGVAIVHANAIDLLDQHAADPSWVFYLDPPYMHKTRSAKSAYGDFELDNAEHERLATAANKVSGVVAVAGYDCSEYNRWYAGWERVEWKMPVHAGQSKRKRTNTEVMWIKHG